MSLAVRIVQVDVPAGHLDRTVAFWSAALSARPVTAPGGFVHLLEATSAVEVHVQPIGTDDGRLHLDLVADDRDVEVERLEGLGATTVARFDDGYTVIEDPAGLQLCVIDGDAAEVNPLCDAIDGRGHLGAVFLDVPEEHVDGEVAFWSAALAVDAGAPQGAYVPLRGVVAASGDPLDLEVQTVGSASRIHVDLAAPDVDAEVVRLVALGARRVGVHEDWVTLSDPCGNLLCVVPTEGHTSR
ncbi:MAG: VOC family protein [Nitriliruptoraceae bacterium]